MIGIMQTLFRTVAADVDMLWQYLLRGDILGFIIACYTMYIGEGFFMFVMLVAFGVVYMETKNLMVVAIAWTLIGSLFIVMAPLIAPLVYLFWVLGVTGTLWEIFARGKK